MKKYLVLLWLLLPLPVVVLHFSKGQRWLALDEARALVTRGESAEQRGEWEAASNFYQEAARLAGSESPDMRLRLDLAKVRAKFRNGEAVEAIDGVDRLLDDGALAGMPLAFRREVRELAGRIHYFAAWVMRLEGAQRDLWMEEAELSRQSYRLLVEESSDAGDSRYADLQQRNHESAVQLQRMSLTELMARPLPKEGQCMCNQGLSEQMAKRRGKRGNKPCRGDDGPPSKGAGMQRFEPGAGS